MNSFATVGGVITFVVDCCLGVEEQICVLRLISSPLHRLVEGTAVRRDDMVVN